MRRQTPGEWETAAARAPAVPVCGTETQTEKEAPGSSACQVWEGSGPLEVASPFGWAEGELKEPAHSLFSVAEGSCLPQVENC